MSNKPDQLRALARFCRRHGGQLAIVSQCEFDDLFDVPKDKRVDGELHESPFTSAHGPLENGYADKFGLPFPDAPDAQEEVDRAP
jgi:hypothetical protein